MNNEKPPSQEKGKLAVATKVAIVAAVIAFLALYWQCFMKPKCEDVRSELKLAREEVYNIHEQLSEGFVNATNVVFDIEDVYDLRVLRGVLAKRVASSLGNFAHRIIELEEFMKRNDIAFKEMDATEANMRLSWAIPKVLFYKATTGSRSASEARDQIRPWLMRHDIIADKVDRKKLKYRPYLEASLLFYEVNSSIDNADKSEILGKAVDAIDSYNLALKLHAKYNKKDRVWLEPFFGKEILNELLLVKYNEQAYLDSITQMCKWAMEKVGQIDKTSKLEEVKTYLVIAEVNLWFYRFEKARQMLKKCIEWCNYRIDGTDTIVIGKQEIGLLKRDCMAWETMCDMFELFKANLEPGKKYVNDTQLTRILKTVVDNDLNNEDDYGGTTIKIMTYIIDLQHDYMTNLGTYRQDILSKLQKCITELKKRKDFTSRPLKIEKILLDSYEKMQQSKENAYPNIWESCCHSKKFEKRLD